MEKRYKMNAYSVKRPVLALSGVSKTFTSESGDHVHAIEKIDMTIEHGDFVIILGPTGCGKTTLLNLIAGLQYPDKGEVNFQNNLSLGRDIAYVFQHYTLFPWRNVLGNVAFGMQMQSINKQQRLKYASELLNKVNLSEFEKAYPHELSGGMRQRTAIAQALAIEPKLLLMDEPFGALDEATRRELQNMLVELWQGSNMTVIFVTHNIEEALVLGQKIFLLKDRPGSIIEKMNIGLDRPRERTSKQFTDLLLKIHNLLSKK
jgi:NitT/TauT family transport system ATP-binding protein